MKIYSLVPLLLIASSLGAQETPSWFNIQGALVGQKDQWLKTSGPSKASFGWGAGVGTWFTPRWGAEISGLGTDVDTFYSHQKGGETHAFLSGLVNLNLGSAWTPYLRFGAGLTELSPTINGNGKRGTDNLNLHAGLGAQLSPMEHLLLGLEARVVRIEANETVARRTELMVLGSAGFRWGGTSKPVSAPVATPTPATVPPPPAPAPEPVKPAPAPEPAPEPVKPAPVPTPEPAPAPVKIVLDEAVLHFANGKAKLSPAGVEAVRKVADSLKAFSGKYSLEVSGHTSSVGSAALNKKLAKQRADAVARVLTESGIPADAITTVGVGPDKPLADNKTKEGQAKNRRVEIDVKVENAKVEIRKTEVADSSAQ